MNDMTPMVAVRTRYVRTWLILVLLAVVGPVLSAQWHAGTVAALAILGMSCYKVRLIGLDFMELRESPRELRLTFEVYCVLLWIVLAIAIAW
ncbi:MAG: cytochrome C oxidase subunit IV family protein [Gordonia sp. (in: high G+C Gram-positive bacteria)]